jgi:transaldolase
MGGHLKTKIFADGANRAHMLELHANPIIQGFTTNPTLMRAAGIADYCAFAQDILKVIHDRPISFEVFSDDFDVMEEQALKIANWGSNVYVKVPVTNTKAEPSYPLIRRLSAKGVKLNVTAVMTLAQVRESSRAMQECPSGYVSVFAGRIADTGRDPVPIMAEAVSLLKPFPNLELIWASPRELLNIFQADAIGCHVITVTADVLKKLSLVGKNLDDYSLDTVKMFHDDALNAGYRI